jgi:hypothetical protein
MTGLGATEYRMLELLSEGGPTRLASDARNERGVFEFREVESILDRLVYCWTPVVAGCPPDIEKREHERARWERLLHSRLTMTDFGKEVLEHELDFSQYNAIDRWWGGTRLTPDRLWRWHPRHRCLIAP